MSVASVIIARDLWGRRVEVFVDPPKAGQPLRSFKAHADALAHAQSLSHAHGWAVVDRSDQEAAA